MIHNDATIHILLTDDDVDDLMLFEEAIKEMPQSVELIAVESGNDLLKLLEDNFNPNFIFLDVNMPGKSGKDCLRLIKSNPQFQSVPVIMYSTSNNKEDIDTCYQCGADLYVIKPVLFTDIVKMLQKIFSLDWKNFDIRSKEEFVLM
ncbi:MAG TPA: response regulator [Flavitalea sp.]|nr:response regulator [Flavitalea sp.]